MSPHDPFVRPPLIKLSPPLPDRPALLLGLQGTLVARSARPARRKSLQDTALRHQLERLHRVLNGALAIYGEDSADELRLMFTPLAVAVVGRFGLEWDFGPSDSGVIPPPLDALERCERALIELAQTNANVVVARGVTAIDVRCPVLAIGFDAVDDLVGRLVDAHPELVVRRAPGQWQIVPAAHHVHEALRRLLRTPAFVGRTPVAVGSTPADLDVLAAARAFGGEGVGVGTAIRGSWQLSGPLAVRAWISAAVDHLCDPRRSMNA
jgi:hypothetical protein